MYFFFKSNPFRTTASIGGGGGGHFYKSFCVNFGISCAVVLENKIWFFLNPLLPLFYDYLHLKRILVCIFFHLRMPFLFECFVVSLVKSLQADGPTKHQTDQQTDRRTISSLEPSVPMIQNKVNSETWLTVSSTFCYCTDCTVFNVWWSP